MADIVTFPCLRQKVLALSRGLNPGVDCSLFLSLSLLTFFCSISPTTTIVSARHQKTLHVTCRVVRSCQRAPRNLVDDAASRAVLDESKLPRVRYTKICLICISSPPAYFPSRRWSWAEAFVHFRNTWTQHSISISYKIASKNNLQVIILRCEIAKFITLKYICFTFSHTSPNLIGKIWIRIPNVETTIKEIEKKTPSKHSPFFRLMRINHRSADHRSAHHALILILIHYHHPLSISFLMMWGHTSHCFKRWL